MDTVLLMDILVAAALLLAAALKAAKGLYKSLMPLLVAVAALIGALILANALTPAVTEAVYPKVEDKIVEKLQENMEELRDELNLSASADVIGEKVKELLPEPLWDLGEKLGELDGLFDAVTEKVGQSASELLTPQQLEKLRGIGAEIKSETESAAEDMRLTIYSAAFETAYSLTRTAVLWAIRILSFLLLYLLLTLLTKALHFTVRLPVIGWVDKLGGAVLGAVECAVLLLILGEILRVFGMEKLHALSEGTRLASFFF